MVRIGRTLFLSVSFAALVAAPRVARAGESVPPTFSGPVARIFAKSCQGCHRPGEIAPMSLLGYRDARPWAKAIRKAVVERTMPPWFADPAVGHFQDDPSLSVDEIQIVSDWVDAGAPEGDSADLPPPVEVAEGWHIGEPDLVVETPGEFVIPADGQDEFVHVELGTGLDEDKVIRAIEVLPGARRAVHHVMVYAIQREGADEEWSRVIGREADLLAERAAGNRGDVYPPGTGRLLKAGSKLLVQVHYHPCGERQTDRTRIGLRFYADPAEAPRRIVSRAVANFDLAIPPGADARRHEASLTLPRAARIVSFRPHMHFRGRSMELRAAWPDGRVERLCAVPRYDPNWQITYTFKTPPTLPPGARLEVGAVFDNSAANPLNPDPAAFVTWGPQATDEMAIGWIDLVYADERG